MICQHRPLWVCGPCMLFSKKGYLSGYPCSEKPILRRPIKPPPTLWNLWAVRGVTSDFSWWVTSHRNPAPLPSFPLWRVVTCSPLWTFVDIVLPLDQAQSSLCLTLCVQLWGREPFLPYSLVLAPMRSHENASWFSQKYVAFSEVLVNWGHVSLRSKLLSAVFTEFTWANMYISLETYCDGWRWLYFNKVRYLQGLPPPMCKSRGLLYKSIVNQETFAPDGTFGNV